MTPEQFAELVEYFRANNSWADDSFYTNGCVKHRVCFKYIEARYDSRDNKYWAVKFYGSVINYGKDSNATKEFRVESKKDIDDIYKFLNTIHVKEKN